VSVVDWLLDADPSIRWQVLRDLTDAPADAVAAERARIAREGVGARLLALQAADGRWGGAAWNRGWDSTMHVLSLLREMGLDPASDAARRARFPLSRFIMCDIVPQAQSRRSLSAGSVLVGDTPSGAACLRANPTASR
jgi:hypothetical protein